MEEVFEYGTAEAFDADDFNVNFESLKYRWDGLRPGFYDCFLTNRKTEFLDSAIVSTRHGTNINGLYYQNDIESLHAKDKRAQNFMKKDVTAAIANLQSLIKREENDEILAVYGQGNYLLSPDYKDFKRPSHVWHSWTPERRDDHLKKFREYRPSLDDSFQK